MTELKIAMRPTGSENALRQMCKTLKTKLSNIQTFVEVGSYMGESAVVFAQEFPNSEIYCIDPWVGNFDEKDAASFSDYSDVEKQFDLRAKNFNNIIKIKKMSTEVDMECDVIYIDGCHKYECVIEDINYWKDKVKYAICGHDYYDDYIDQIQPHTAGVRKAVLELLGHPHERFVDGFWIFYLNQ